MFYWVKDHILQENASFKYFLKNSMSKVTSIYDQVDTQVLNCWGDMYKIRHKIEIWLKGLFIIYSLLGISDFAKRKVACIPT